METLSRTFWNEYVWLPPGTRWLDLKDPPHAIAAHLFYPLPMAVVMLGIRYVLERWWFAPAGRALGVRARRARPPQKNPQLEAAYEECPRLRRPALVALAKRVELSERQVERWWRLRRAQDRPSTLVKFCENSWRCLYYMSSTAFGCYVLWDKPWLWDIDHCYIGYPHQGVTDDVWWYYMISLSFYWSLTVSQFFDIKRKDFWQMFIHHIATIMLMSFSWVCNLHRIGTLVLLLHDIADIFLEAAKMTKYAYYQKLCDCIFGIFTVLWIVTRIGIFPFYIIWSTSIRAPMLVPMFAAYYIFNGLLVLLLVLHVFWTYLILKIAYKALAAGQMEGDIRSSSSDITDDSDNGDLKSNNVGHASNNDHARRADGGPSRRTATRTEDDG